MIIKTKLYLSVWICQLKLIDKKSFNIGNFEDSDDDFSDFSVKNVTVFDYEMVEIEDLEKEIAEK